MPLLIEILSTVMRLWKFEADRANKKTVQRRKTEGASFKAKAIQEAFRGENTELEQCRLCGELEVQFVPFL